MGYYKRDPIAKGPHSVSPGGHGVYRLDVPRGPRSVPKPCRPCPASLPGVAACCFPGGDPCQALRCHVGCHPLGEEGRRLPWA